MQDKNSPFFINIEDAPKFMQMEGLETTILSGLHGEKMTMALNATLPGHTVPMHSHKHEQIGIVYAGEAKLRIGDDERIAKKGDFYRIPSNTPHGDTCISKEPFIMLDIFYPSRKDFLKKLRSEVKTPKVNRNLHNK
ncbi:MAG: cupin domain-containing protein [Candidatus Thorarchaeota archaeon]